MKHKQQIRENFRNEVFERDGFACKCCGESEGKLDAHHIVDRSKMPNGGYVKQNGITLCEPCHELAEIWHQTHGEDWHDHMRPIDLFNLIGSNIAIAIQASEKLK